MSPHSSKSFAEKPPSFWDELRNRTFHQDVPRAANDSAVIAVDGVRLARLVSIMPYSEIRSDSSRIASEVRVYLEAAGFLAMQHFNQRSGELLPHLPQRLDQCNVYFTMDMYDSLFSPIVASRQLYKILVHPHSLLTPLPVAVVGAARSAVSLPLSVLAGAYNVPQMNAISTSAALDNKDRSPTFMRTVPTNAIDARATVEYFRSLGVYRFGVMFSRDVYGSEFSRNLQNAAKMYDMSVVAVSYEDRKSITSSIRDALQVLKNSELKYFFGVFSPELWIIKTILREARDAGIIGNADHVWLLSDSAEVLTHPAFYKNSLRSGDPGDLKVVEAISGIGVVLFDIPDNDAFEQAMNTMWNDSGLVDYYISKHDYPVAFENFSFGADSLSKQPLSYDAVMTIGIAMCDAEQEFITTTELVDQIMATKFEGASGSVGFDAITGTRSSESVAYKVVNLVVEATEAGIRLNASDSASIKLDTPEVRVKSPFVYGRGSLQAPPSLPTLEPELNLIPTWAQSFVWCLSGLVVLTSIGFGLWVCRNRKAKLVQAAQPPFLLLLCLGTFLMALALVPMGLQEPVSQSGLNIACMSVPWLLVLGFSFAISSLACKAIRLNKVFKLSLQMKRSTVQVKDATWPLVVILTSNIILLVSWSVVAPMRWVRTENTQNLDHFERPVESYGNCDHGVDQGGVYFLRSLFLINIIFVVFASYQSYLTRNMPSEFNEHYFLSVSMASTMETFLLGVPIMFLANENPTASFTAFSLIIVFLCWAIQLPMFLSKIIMRQQQMKSQSENPWQKALNTARAARAKREGGATAAETTSCQGQNLPPSSDTIEEIRLRAARRLSNWNGP